MIINVSFQQFNCVNYFLISGVCSNMLPPNYNCSICDCDFTCDDWAGKRHSHQVNLCNERWTINQSNVTLDCAPQTTGLVKEYCTVSCDACSKYIIL